MKAKNVERVKSALTLLMSVDGMDRATARAAHHLVSGVFLDYYGDDIWLGLERQIQATLLAQRVGRMEA